MFLGKVETLKKLFKTFLILCLILSFSNTANAIVDENKSENKAQPTEEKTTKKKFLERIKIDKTSKDEKSKDEVVLTQEAEQNQTYAEKSSAKVQIQENSTLNLEDCINIALQNSPHIRKYQDLVTVANSLLGQTKSNYFPSLNLGTGYTGNYLKEKHYSSDFENSYGINASISQLLFSFGKVSTLIKKSKLNKIAADLDLNNEIIKTIFNVKTNYYGVLAAAANIKVQEANILVNERQYQQTKAYFEEGLKSKIDLVNSEVYLSNAKLNYVSAQNTYDLAVVALNNSMYIDGNPNYSISKIVSFNFDNKYTQVALKNTNQDEVKEFKAPALEDGAVYKTSVQKNELLNKSYDYTKFPYTIEESITLAKNNRPDLKSYVAARDALKKELTYQKLQYLPDLKATGGYNFNATKSDNQSNSFQIRGSLDFPTINVMNIKYKIDEAKARLDIADSTVDQLEKDIYFNVQKAYVNMVQNGKKIPLTEVAVRQTFENLELAMGRYEVGLGNFLEVQDAIVNYNQAQESYVKLIFDYNVSVAKLELEIAQIEEKYNKFNQTENPEKTDTKAENQSVQENQTETTKKDN